MHLYKQSSYIRLYLLFFIPMMIHDGQAPHSSLPLLSEPYLLLEEHPTSGLFFAIIPPEM